MKKKLVCLFSMILLCFSIVLGVCACKPEETNEDIVYKVVCYVAEEEGVTPKDVEIVSGAINYDEEDKAYSLNLKISVYSYYTYYYSGMYNPETKAISYVDVTRYSSIVGANFFKTNSFDISAVNQRLQNN